MGQIGVIRTANFDISTGTTTTPVAAVTGYSIVVIHAFFSFTFTTSGTAKFQDGAGTALSGTVDVAGIYAWEGRRQTPIMSTAQGQSLQIVTTTGGTISMHGFIVYRLDTA